MHSRQQYYTVCDTDDMIINITLLAWYLPIYRWCFRVIVILFLSHSSSRSLSHSLPYPVYQYHTLNLTLSLPIRQNLLSVWPGVIIITFSSSSSLASSPLLIVTLQKEATQIKFSTWGMLCNWWCIWELYHSAAINLKSANILGMLALDSVVLHYSMVCVDHHHNHMTMLHALSIECIKNKFDPSSIEYLNALAVALPCVPDFANHHHDMVETIRHSKLHWK